MKSIIFPEFFCIHRSKDWTGISYLIREKGEFVDSIVLIKPTKTNLPWLPIPEGGEHKEWHELYAKLELKRSKLNADKT